MSELEKALEAEAAQERQRAEAAEARVAELEKAPLCGDHADSWYTAREHIKTSTGCIMCDWHAVRTGLEARVGELEAALEQDRTTVADGINAIREAIRRREWLRLGRGSYEWDDDRWRGEFGEAIDEIVEATKPLQSVASNWQLCPPEQERIKAARAALSGSPAPVGEAEPEDSEEVQRLQYQVEALKTALFDIPECDWRAAWWQLWLTGSDRGDHEAMELIRKAAPRIEEVKLKSDAERAVVEAAMSFYEKGDGVNTGFLLNVLSEACHALAKARKRHVEFKFDERSEIKPHIYAGDATHMGDCSVCGNRQDHPLHSDARKEGGG